ncbi:transporter [uncultured Subdoligranulum sp.]|uniref:transporter n=1 Tax=uncultured Subdoligranulum sp. TaxID=512298 RepID=UPI00320A638F
MEQPKNRTEDTALHGKEERVKRIFRDQIAEAAGILEVVLSGIVLVGLLFSVVPLVQWMPGLIVDGNDVEVYNFLTRALDIVIGIEFIKMLAKHSPGSVLEVLLYAIARHMIVGHEDAVQNLVSVAAIALIFIIRRFFFVPSFGQKMPGGQIAPDLAHLYSPDEEEGRELGDEKDKP